MVKIRMLKSENGSPYGTAVFRYIKDETYEIPESLAEVFIEDLKVAEPVIERTVDSEGAKVVPPKTDTPAEVKDRKDLVVTAITAIYDEVQKEPRLKDGLFTDKGYPRVEAVRERTQFEVTSTEIKDIWKGILDEIEKDKEKTSIWTKLFGGSQ